MSGRKWADLDSKLIVAGWMCTYAAKVSSAVGLWQYSGDVLSTVEQPSSVCSQWCE